MKKEIKLEQPIAHICINKSRVKMYNKETEPTIYLAKQTEFQIELFNPTTDVVLAKISLNNNLISQGGLILNPGQRVFLERYIDVPKKFLFDTYEVSNSEEVKKAIELNGDVKIEFFREYIQPATTTTWVNYNSTSNLPINLYNTSSLGKSRSRSSDDMGFNFSSSNNTNNVNGTLSLTSMDFMNQEMSKTFFDGTLSDEAPVKKQMRGRKLSKSIETGRVEQGSHSSQEFKMVNKTFSTWPFHTIEYKLLPVSQKVNTVDDLNVKVYCTNCGSKLGKTDRFCAQCGKKR
jgi:hypothetical protein